MPSYKFIQSALVNASVVCNPTADEVRTPFNEHYLVQLENDPTGLLYDATLKLDMGSYFEEWSDKLNGWGVYAPTLLQFDPVSFALQNDEFANIDRLSFPFPNLYRSPTGPGQLSECMIDYVD